MPKKWQSNSLCPSEDGIGSDHSDSASSDAEKKRGYNQAQIVACELGRRLGIPVDASSLYRRIPTSPQKTLGHGERKANLRKAFALGRGFVPVPTVLLVDDIYTTGNTMDAAADILKQGRG